MALQIIEGSIDAPPPSGRVISVDNEKFIYGTKHKVGKFIPKNLGSEFATSDAVVFLKQTTLFYDLIFEDTMHTVEMTKAIYDVAVDHLIAGGIIISHDAVHPKFKGAVVAGIRQSGIEPEVYLVEGDSCGLAIWQKPKTQLDIVYQTGKALPDESIIGDSTPTILNQNIPDETEATPEVPKKAPKRRRRKKASKSVKDMYPSGVPETIDKGISEGIERIKTAIEEV